MRNASTTITHALLAAMLLASCTAAQAVDLLSPIKGLFGSDDVIVWQGPGQFVKIVDQDRIKKDRRVAKNSHPAELTPGQLSMVLAALKLEGSSARVFTPGEVALLAEKLAEGLHRAQDRQDVVFAVIGGAEGGAKHTTAGRVFVADGRLQIIFGDVHGAVDGDPSDTSHYVEPHRAGKRKERVARDTAIAAGPGIRHEVMNERERSDWVMIDIPTAVAAPGGPAVVPVAPPVAAPGLPAAPQGAATAVTPPAATPVTAPITPEQQKQLEERRQMAEEMARLRKQLQEQEAAAGGATTTGTASVAPAGPATTPGKSLEDRLKQLRSLHEKKLITDEEYAVKRKALLEEL